MSVPMIESLEGRTFLSASPDVIAADRAAIAADRAQIAQYVRQKNTTLVADQKDLIAAIVAKAKNAGLLRRDLVQQALSLGRTLLQHRRENMVAIRAVNLEIIADRKAGDTAALQEDLTRRATLVQAKNDQLKTDLQAIRDAYRSVEPQVKAFLVDAKPEIDAIRARLASNRTSIQQLIFQARQQLQAHRLQLQQDLRA